MTDRILPDAFPTTDERVFTATLRNALDVERPPPTFTYSTSATSYDLLAGIPERAFYPKTTTKRLLVVLTDGESRPFGGDLTRAFQRKPRVETVFVRIWGKNERIYETGVAEGWVPRPTPRAPMRSSGSPGFVGGRHSTSPRLTRQATRCEARKPGPRARAGGDRRRAACSPTPYVTLPRPAPLCSSSGNGTSSVFPRRRIASTRVTARPRH